MRTIRLLAVALSLGTAACATGPAAGGMQGRPLASGPELAGTTTLSGFVVLYRDEPVYLLSGGIEIPLAGATDRLVQRAGLQVTVSGRYLGTGTFMVDGANPQTVQSISAVRWPE